MILTNFPDSKCCYGYMTLCPNCIIHAPKWVDTKSPIDSTKQYLPGVNCELCGKRGKI